MHHLPNPQTQLGQHAPVGEKSTDAASVDMMKGYCHFGASVDVSLADRGAVIFGT